MQAAPCRRCRTRTALNAESRKRRHGSLSVPLLAAAFLVAGTLASNAEKQSAPNAKADTSAHTVQMVVVEPAVKLEVLDWGGTGRPLVLLAGAGNNAHVYDTFAAMLTPRYHVYAITRRGFGASDAPEPDGGNYSADRMADDDIAVLDQLKIVKPVLAGHSLAGEELSSIGNRFPDKVAALIYLDAGYRYALYDAAHPDVYIDMSEMRRKLYTAATSLGAGDAAKAIDDVLKSWPALAQELETQEKQLEAAPADVDPKIRAAMASPSARSSLAIGVGMQRFTAIHCPVLAIFAYPHDWGTNPQSPASATGQAFDKDVAEPQIHLFQTAMPNAKVVVIPSANHYVFQSNAPEVSREMDAFIGTLK